MTKDLLQVLSLIAAHKHIFHDIENEDIDCLHNINANFKKENKDSIDGSLRVMAMDSKQNLPLIVIQEQVIEYGFHEECITALFLVTIRHISIIYQSISKHLEKDHKIHVPEYKSKYLKGANVKNRHVVQK